MAVNQLKAGAFLSYVSIGLNNVVGLLYTPFMLRMMGQSEYGLYSLVASVVAYLTVLDLGFGNAIVRYTAKFRAEGKIREQYEMFGMFFLLYIGIGILVLLVGAGLYFNIDRLFGATMNENELYKIRVMMLLMVFNLAFTFPMSIWGAVITAYENFVFQKLVNIARIILNPLAMIVMLMIGYRAIGMVVVTTIFNIITLLINYWYCKKKINIRVRFGHFRWGFLKEVSIYSFWIFIDSLVTRYYINIGQLVVGIYCGSLVVAIYALAIQLLLMYSSFSSAINSLLLPKITTLVANNSSSDELSSLFIRIGRIQFFVISFILVGFVIFGREFIVLWGGVNYYKTYYIALLIFIPFSFDLITNVGITILQAKNKLKYRSIPMLITAFVGIMIMFPMTDKFGVWGCAVVTSASILISNVIISNIMFYKIVNINVLKMVKDFGKMLWFPVLSIIFCFFIKQNIQIENWFDLILYILLFSVVYIPVFLAINLNGYEKNILKLILRNIIYKV